MDLISRTTQSASKKVKLQSLIDAENRKKTYLVPRDVDTYLQFCDWYAAPLKTRDDIWGAKTQQEFSAKFDVSQKTLSQWKKRPEFYRMVNDHRQQHAQDRFTEVFEGLIIGAKKGYADNVELYLNYFEGWHKSQILEVRNKVDLQLGDIRRIIEVLPKEQQHEFYTTIARLLHAAKRAQSGGDPGPAGGTGQLEGPGDLAGDADQVPGDVQ